MILTLQKKTKIIFCLPSLAGGGAERIVIQYMNALDKTHYDAELCTALEDGPLRPLVNTDIPITILGSWRISTCIPRLWWHLRRHRADIVVSTVTHMNFAALVCKLFLPHVKFIAREAIVPSFFFHKYPRFKKPLTWVFRFLYPRADILLSPSREIMDEFETTLKLGTSNCRLLYNPVDMPLIGEQKKQDVSPHVPAMGPRKMHFVCAGRLEPQKAFDRLLDMLGTLHAPYDWDLTMLGDGSMKETLCAQIAKHGLQDKVHMIGWHINPYAFYARADYFLISSRYEGMPNVALESLACGTPILSIRHNGGINGIAAKAGENAVRLFDTMDDFAAHLRTLIPPSDNASDKPSLLPPDFDKPRIMAQFQDMVAKLAAN